MNKVKVLIDSPDRNSNLLYKSGFFCIDPFIFADHDDIKTGWLPSTELEKAKKTSSLDQIYNLTEELEKIRKDAKYPVLKSSILIDWFKKNNISEIFVPPAFPLAEADNLRNFQINVVCIKEPFYEERVTKTEKELNFIRENSRKNASVMKEVHDLLASSSITNEGFLKYDNQILTSEFMQNFIIKSFFEKDLIAANVIVSSGDQGCDPHEYGTGNLSANKSIIVDIFPRNRYNLYYTDMTRTFCKGKAGYELKKIYNDVLNAQKIGLDKVKDKAYGKNIHREIQEYFSGRGYKTGIISGTLQGFFHSTGHGLGLDCHEPPYISNNDDVLKFNSVVSVEPGLYYIGSGAVRIEDLVAVKKDEAEILTANQDTNDKILEIP
jgi:Xaa-Pro aminopeptidase